MSPLAGADLYKPLLREVSAAARKYGEDLQPPCEGSELADLGIRSLEQLGCDLVPSYAEFLALHNGLDWNGLVIYACGTVPIVGHEDRFIEDFVESNLIFRDDARMRQLLVFGDSDLLLYVFDRRTGEFSSIDRVSMDRHDVFGSFEEMLAGALCSRLE